MTQREIWVAGNLLNDGTAAMILYCYFALNSNDYTFALSPTRLYDVLGLSERQYIKARDRLKEKGYLVPRSGEKDSYTFLRIPTKYLDVPLNDIEIPSHQEIWHEKRAGKKEKNESHLDGPCLGQAEIGRDDLPVSIQAEASVAESCMAESEGRDQNTPRIVEQSPHEKGDQSCINGGRNITDSINNNTNNSTDIQQRKDEVLKLRRQIKEWEEKIRNEFSDLPECEDELKKISFIARNKWHSDQKHLSLLEKCYNSLKDRVELEERHQKNLIQKAYDSTMPESALDYMKVVAIFNRLIEEGRISSRNGAWLQGWNEEDQTVNLVELPADTPLDVIRSQRHILDGIPKWYWRKSTEE